MLKQKTNEKTTNIFLQTGETIGYYGVMFSMAYNTIWYNTIQYDTIQYKTMQYKMIQYKAIQKFIALSTYIHLFMHSFRHSFDRMKFLSTNPNACVHYL